MKTRALVRITAAADKSISSKIKSEIKKKAVEVRNKELAALGKIFDTAKKALAAEISVESMVQSVLYDLGEELDQIKNSEVKRALEETCSFLPRRALTLLENYLQDAGKDPSDRNW